MIGGCQRLNVVEANPKVRYFDTDRTQDDLGVMAEVFNGAVVEIICAEGP
jgi:hypothetical protein